MATTNELAEAISTMIASSATSIPVTLMNHRVEEAAEIIGAVIERCAEQDIDLVRIHMDPELALELGLVGGAVLPHGSRPTVQIENGLGRQLRFVRR